MATRGLIVSLPGLQSGRGTWGPEGRFPGSELPIACPLDGQRHGAGGTQLQGWSSRAHMWPIHREHGQDPRAPKSQPPWGVLRGAPTLGSTPEGKHPMLLQRLFALVSGGPFWSRVLPLCECGRLHTFPRRRDSTPEAWENHRIFWEGGIEPICHGKPGAGREASRCRAWRRQRGHICSYHQLPSLQGPGHGRPP